MEQKHSTLEKFLRITIACLAFILFILNIVDAVITYQNISPNLLIMATRIIYIPAIMMGVVWAVIVIGTIFKFDWLLMMMVVLSPVFIVQGILLIIKASGTLPVMIRQSALACGVFHLLVSLLIIILFIVKRKKSPLAKDPRNMV